MRKAIGILCDEMHPLIERVGRTLVGRGIGVDFVPWHALSYEDGAAQALSQYQAIYLDRLGERKASYGTQLELLKFCQPAAAPRIVNSPTAYAIARNKGLSAAAFARLGIPTPRTVVATSVEALHDFCDRQTTASIVTKPIWGCCAAEISVFRRESISPLAISVLERDGMIVAQTFLRNPDHFIWRIDIVDGVIIVANQRFAYNQNDEHPICNGTQGGHVQFWRPEDVPQNASTLARDAARKMDLVIAGVDIIQDGTGSLAVLEVNPEPDITLDRYEFPDAIARYLESL